MKCRGNNVLLFDLCNFGDGFRGVEPDDFGKCDQLGNTDSALSRLDQCHPLLAFADALGDLRLRESPGSPLIAYKRDQCSMPWCSDDFHPGTWKRALAVTTKKRIVQSGGGKTP